MVNFEHYQITLKLTSALFALNSSGCRSKVGCIPRVIGVNPRSIVRYCGVLNSMKNDDKVAMSAAAVSRSKPGGVFVDLRLEDLEGTIGRLTNGLCQFPVWEQRKRYIRHSDTVYRLYEDSERCGMEQCDAGMKT
jgi:hypothetical protein